MSPWFRNLSIAHKLRLAIISVASIAIVLVMGLGGVLSYVTTHQDLVDESRATAQMIGMSGSAALAFADDRFADKLLAGFLLDPKVKAVRIVMADGVTLAEQVAVEPGRGVPPGRLDELLLGSSVVVRETVTLDNEIIGYVYVVADDSVLLDARESFLAMGIGAILLAGLIASLVAVPFERIIASPLLTLSAEMRRVSQEEDYSGRLESGANDEIGELIDSFNLMLVELEGREHKLRLHRVDLERQVANRTADLEEANRQLTLRIEEVNHAKEEALAAAQAKSQFLANMSHEIRTPMNGVMGMLEVVQESTLDTFQRECLDVAYGSAESLLGIINDVLDLSKIEAGKMALESIEMRPGVIIEEVCAILRPRAEERGLDFSIDLASAYFDRLTGDPTRYRQIVINLVGNAIKFTERGGVALRGRLVEAGGDRHTLRLEVIDSGIGISPAAQQQLFEAFTQADDSNTRRFGGTGLGLTISRQLTELFDGELNVESEEGKGSIFSLTVPFGYIGSGIPAGIDKLSAHLINVKGREHDLLRRYLRNLGVSVGHFESPDVVIAGSGSTTTDLRHMVETWPDAALLAFDHPHELPGDNRHTLTLPVKFSQIERILEAVATPDASLDEQAVKPVFEQAKVLLVEDNPVNQKVAVAMLGQFGIKPDIADNGRQGFDAYCTGSYDLILMDCQMPLMDGFESTRAMRAFEEEQGSHGVPIVALTANAMEGDSERCHEAGMNDFLSKPFKSVDLGRVLGRWL